MNPKVIVVAPGEKTHGGITKVVSYYRSSDLWNNYSIKWIETHRTGNILQKIHTLTKAIFIFLYYAPSYNIAHIHYTGCFSAHRKLIFFKISKFFKLKIVSHIHAPNLNIEAISNSSFRTMISESEEVIVLSRVWAEKLKQFVNREYIILNNPSQGFIESGVKKENLILFAGKLEKRKGYIDLLYALTFLKEATKDYLIILAGNGEVELANDFIIQNHLKNVKAIGWQDNEDVLKLFRRAEIFVLPSYGEGFPISIIDALSNKCAVITTSVGGIPDFLTDKENCLFVDPGDVNAISIAIKSLIVDVDLKNKISSNGFELACREFDISKITSKLSDIYNNLLG